MRTPFGQQRQALLDGPVARAWRGLKARATMVRCCSAPAGFALPWRRARIALWLSVLCALGLLASASCPGMCSSQGKCGKHDVCECDRGFFGADCSMRRCPSGLAVGDVVNGDLNHDGVAAAGTYVDVQWSSLQVPERMPAPDGSSVESPLAGADRAGLTARRGVSHFPAECSGRGSCDYTSGQCLCVEGFEGSACQRMSCPSGCSNNGECRTAAEVAKNALNRKRLGFFGDAELTLGVREPLRDPFRLWSADTSRVCVCDPGFRGHDCSLRACPRGPDPLATGLRHCGDMGCLDEAQRFEIAPDEPTLFRFGLASWEGQDRHALVTLHTGANGGQGAAANAAIIEHALGLGIADHELERIAVSGVGNPGSIQEFVVTFVNSPGNHPLLKVEHVSGPARVVPGSLVSLRDGTKDELECSGRGLCDEKSGLCKCFPGYGREDCASQMSPTALLELRRAELAQQKRKTKRSLERAKAAAPDGHARLKVEVEALTCDAGDERQGQASFLASWGAGD